MRAFKTVMAAVCGSAAFFFLVMSGQPGSGQVPSIVCFCLFALLTFLLGRRTAADRRRIAEQRGRMAGQEAQRAAPREEAGRSSPSGAGWLAGATVLHVLAAPFLILRDLMKMQK